MSALRKAVRSWAALDLDQAGFPINGRWQESARPAYCISCMWSGAIKDIAYLKGDSFPFRCPSCGGIVAEWKGNE